MILLLAVQFRITDYLLVSDHSINSSLFIYSNVSKVQEEEAKEGSKPQVLVVGFANLIWSLYLMFLVSEFGLLFIVNQLVGQIILFISLISNLSLVKINYTLKFHDLSSKSNKSKVDLNVIIGLHFLGYLVFFGTGHQATFAMVYTTYTTILATA
ncbi:hypothetical protein PSTG_07726 [Puccinia striiformis f. sp. tritici PST-78]|uniref:Uncharacterized protein n=1 Tax=Puccinia striiformis f. sp. tritici PST-78 TaxID=1165861 RepID=A0A0L0VIG4_9BASI|nr:hypothetical protein PSTG_07726 [Puccinia striiformis f. sp. tritici PST-78]